jgi:alkylation response protein AidB-like acyl-CoA dehydrogenase
VNGAEDPCVRKAAELAREVVARHADDVDRRGRWPAESMEALGRAGLLGLTVPAALGGAAEGPRTFVVVTSTLAENCASTAMIYLMHTCGIQVIAAAASFPHRDEVLRAAAAGRHLCTLAFSEKGSRSHFWAPVSRAQVEGDRQRLSADKSFVTSAGHADSYVVSTGSAAGQKPTDSTLYFVPRDAAGVHVSGTWDGLGLRGNASAPVRLENVAVSGDQRLSGEGKGFEVMMQTVLPWFQLGSAAVAVGIARAATASIRRHLLASRLEHLGQSLASLPNLRARLAQMHLTVATQEAFLDHAARQVESAGSGTLLAVLESKATAAEAALAVTDFAMRTGGAASFSRQLGVERNFRDARAGWIMAPTTDVLYDFIGRALLDMPFFDP